jgi:hypothetical protein
MDQYHATFYHPGIKIFYARKYWLVQIEIEMLKISKNVPHINQ